MKLAYKYNKLVILNLCVLCINLKKRYQNNILLYAHRLKLSQNNHKLKWLLTD
ncbi:hypothetical protein A1OE_1245 [Candidatus Endolissoclinum faulkneri L2]|uniref:Uncharacterized protein n=1 Tax=Candidatus Endolissoclinum faulkneri L2 TaxID=1193729 RepID=K7YSB4_9PROT|nr:hypothetical protein A1OE_1245 [Candidatus Endolissoclinum faulkneri L2]